MVEPGSAWPYMDPLALCANTFPLAAAMTAQKMAAAIFTFLEIMNGNSPLATLVGRPVGHLEDIRMLGSP
jgi:hypothetical protein